ncbi:PepSY domain-containing protein [Sphingomonas canadensis]|uniref:PepSY domain-containing protein n=1 Tax=Sphingomonas canadensis TaxID=1219257 RepID=UPI0036D3797A|nr:PepSY domain-containing protein [Sphingomonas canadensis]
MRLHIGASRLHRWLALVIGVQLLLWFSSGLVMSLLPIDRVRGEHLVDREAAAALPASARYVSPQAIIAASDGPVRALRHRMLLGRPVVETETGSGALQLYDGATGVRLPPIDARQAEAIALGAYRGTPAPDAAVERVTAVSTEYKGRVPAWRVALADADSTRIYVTDTGTIAAVRTGTWRLYDFFWGLHIMDWSEHENFNTPWLKAFAFGGLALAIAGTILLYLRWPRRKRRRAEG